MVSWWTNKTFPYNQEPGQPGGQDTVADVCSELNWLILVNIKPFPARDLPYIAFMLDKLAINCSRNKVCGKQSM